MVKPAKNGLGHNSLTWLRYAPPSPAWRSLILTAMRPPVFVVRDILID
jgi:hypothetical protein